MIRIIKPSKLSYVFSCTNYECQCIFSCEEQDLKKHRNVTFVICPVCKKEVRIIKEPEIDNGTNIEGVPRDKKYWEQLKRGI